MSTRRRRSVSVGPRPFSDSAPDTSDASLGTWGAPQFFGATGQVPPGRFSVHRLLQLDTYGRPESRLELSLLGVKGARAPFASPRRSPAVRLGSRAPVARRASLAPPAHASQFRFPRRSWSSFNAVTFREPRKEVICVRRSARRGVLFARGVAGRRGSAPGRNSSYHRNQFSSWSCNR